MTGYQVVGGPTGAAPSGNGRGPLRVLLVAMPFGALERPSLALGLLHAGAARVGADVETRHLTFEFADDIGVDTYQWLANTVPYEAFVGEWLFTDALHGPDEERRRAFLDEHLGGRWQLAPADRARIDQLRHRATAFVARAAAGIDWAGYDLIGFTSTFQQNVPSLALARAVRERAPDALIAFGGANWEGDMGVALHQTYPFVDLAFSGEADLSFPAVLSALARHKATGARPGPDGLDGADLAAIGGITFRQGGRTVTTEPGPPLEDLDQLPLPSYDSWFAALLASTAAETVAPTLLLETGRGCWWGERHHCTFCGLNGASMSFRSKSPDRVLAEIDTLADRWAVDTFAVVDNILDMRYFRSVLPRLAQQRRYRFFWEIKSNLTAAQVELLAAAGVDHVQPGIESMADDVLRRMDKGTTRLRNLALLRHCREYGVTPEWNLLYGFPGESADDYTDMARLFKAITHLQPPSGHGQIRLDRFSPYHNDPAAHGLGNVRPAQPFGLLHPVDPATLERMAYYFTFDYDDGRQPARYAAPVLAAIETWRRAHATSGLWAVADGDGGLTLIDERTSRRRTAHLRGGKAAVYNACDRPCTREQLADLGPLDGLPGRELGAFLDRCVHTGVMATDGTAYLSLAVWRPARTGTGAAEARRSAPRRYLQVRAAAR